MLSGAGLGDDPLLAHPPREQRLAEGVVDFVRPGMQEVLALEIDLCPAAVLRQPLREIQLGWPAREVLEVPLQLRLETGVRPRHLVGRGQLRQRCHERLRHEDAAVLAEMPGGIGQAGEIGEGNGGGHRRTGQRATLPNANGISAGVTQCAAGLTHR